MKPLANARGAATASQDVHLPKLALFVLLSRNDDFLEPRVPTRLAASSTWRRSAEGGPGEPELD